MAFGTLLILITSGLLYYSIYISQHAQANSWLKYFPSNVLINLVDSDYFSIETKVNLLESTNLFSNFYIYDMDKKPIVGFGELRNLQGKEFVPIVDSGSQVWGYYQFNENFQNLLYTVFLFCSVSTLLLIVLLVMQTRQAAKLLSFEHTTFNKFLENLSRVRNELSNIKTAEDINKIKVILDDKSSDIESKNILENFKELITDIVNLQNRLSEYLIKEEETRAKMVFAKIATQMAHDIRSPLMALKIIADSMNTTDSEKKKIITEISLRINEIAEDMLTKSKNYKTDHSSYVSNSISSFDINSAVISIINEKKSSLGEEIQFKFHNSDNLRFIQTEIDEVSFKRIISNLLNNSVEALTKVDRSKTINVYINYFKTKVRIGIMDNGVGIPSNIVKRIGEPKFSYNKVNGNGLGVSAAMEAIKAVGGNIEINSKLGIGTEIIISFPTFTSTYIDSNRPIDHSI